MSIHNLQIADPKFNIRGITEERGFTNPHIRFRRIRGRIVPIVNKKRIGQDVSTIGEKTVLGGAALAAATLLAKKTKIGKAITKPLSKFSIKTNMFNVKPGDGFKMRSMKRMIKLSGKASKFGMKNSGKISLGLLGLGTATKIVGDEIQMRSGFGKDFFFIKDRQGRGA